MEEHKLKLGEIYVAREAWTHLAALKLPAHTAYRLMKYGKKVQAELLIIEGQRVKLIRQVANAGEKEEVELKPNSPEINSFVEAFGEYLDVDSELEQFSMNFDSFMDLISKNGNELTIEDIGLLEPFFANKEK